MTTALTLQTFSGLLGDLDEADLAAFVADLWDETGWETRTEGDVVIATRSDARPQERRFRVVPDDRSPIARALGREEDVQAEGSETVVLGYQPRTVEHDHETVLDAADLYERLLFALDRETCRELCERHFDRTVEPAPGRTSGSADLPLPIRVRRALLDRGGRHRIVASAAILVVLLAAAVVAGVPSGGDPEPIPSAAAESEDAPTPVGGGITPAAGEPAGTATAAGDGSERVALIPIDWSNRANVGAVPDCNRSPTEVVEVFLTATRLGSANDTERYLTMALFTDSRTFPPPGEFETAVREFRRGPTRVFFTFRQALFGEDRFVQDPNPNLDRLDRSTIVQDVVLIDDGTRYVFEFILTERNSGDLMGCWQIQAIKFVSPTGETLDDGTPTGQPSTETAQPANGSDHLANGTAQPVNSTATAVATTVANATASPEQTQAGTATETNHSTTPTD